MLSIKRDSIRKSPEIRQLRMRTSRDRFLTAAEKCIPKHRAEMYQYISETPGTPIDDPIQRIPNVFENVYTLGDPFPVIVFMQIQISIIVRIHHEVVA